MGDQVRHRFGNRVRELREGQGISLRRFAMVIGLDKTYLSEIERGMRSPTLDSIDRIAQGLGMPLSELFKGVDSIS